MSHQKYLQVLITSKLNIKVCGLNVLVNSTSRGAEILLDGSVIAIMPYDSYSVYVSHVMQYAIHSRILYKLIVINNETYNKTYEKFILNQITNN